MGWRANDIMLKAFILICGIFVGAGIMFLKLASHLLK